MHPIVARLHALDEALARKGFPRTSPWWLETLARFYGSGRRQLVLRVGRRGGKSSTLCRVGVCEALYGEHRVPPGDVGVVAFVSVKREEASERLRTIRAILDALAVKYRPIEGGLELVDRPVAFRVYTGSVAGVSGFTAICVIGDEVAKWRDADTGANPAREVLASIRPTMATQRNARMFLSSSPMGRLDAHAAAFDEGETARQCVAFAQTWIANPTVTEEETHLDEPDEDRWRREYAAIPLEESESSLLSAALLDRVTRADRPDLPPENGYEYAAQMDPATRGNAWTLVVATRRREGDRIRRVVVLAREWKGSSASPLLPDRVLTSVRDVLAPYSLERVWTDQHHGDSLVAIGRRIGLQVVVDPMTAGKKLETYENLATSIADREIELPPHAQLRADLLAVRRRLTPNGFTIHMGETPDGRHADYAPAVAGVMGRFLREPRAIDARTAVDLEQAASLERARRRFGVQSDAPWWKKGA